MRGRHQVLEFGSGPIEAPSIPDRVPSWLGREERHDGARIYRVVLWNDAVSTMDHVITALIRVVPSLDLQQAVTVMATAHQQGSAIVAEAPREQAELYREGLERHGLTVTIERA